MGLNGGVAHFGVGILLALDEVLLCEEDSVVESVALQGDLFYGEGEEFFEFLAHFNESFL